MASPQLENGHLRLSNELAEALMKVPLNGSQWRIVMGVIRESYGWNRKLAPLSMRRLAAMTGMARRNVRREVAALVKAGVIVRQDQDGEGTMLGIGKDYESWKFEGGRGASSPQGVNSPPGVNWQPERGGEFTPLKEKTVLKTRVRAKKPHATDARFVPIRDHYCRRYQETRQEKADFGGRDAKALDDFLKQHPELTPDMIFARLENAFTSTSGFPLDRKFRLYEFLTHHAKYSDGPRHSKSSGQSDGKGNGQGATAQTPLLVGRSRPTPEGEAILKNYGVH